MRNNIVKTLVCLLLCSVMVFALCACNPTNPDGPIDPDKNKWWTTEGELTKDADGKVQFKNINLRLETVVAGDDKDAFNMIVGMFNREYNGKIRINVTNTGAGVYENQVAQKISNDSNAPDIIMSHQKSHKSFADNKLIQPLNEAMELSGITINSADYAEGLAKYMSAGYEGYTFSVPADGQSLAVFYNKKLLAEIGKDLPTNYTELLDVCKAYKDKYSKVPIAWVTGGDYFNEYVYTSAVLQNGGKLYNESTYMAEWYDDQANRDAFANASKAFRQLFSEGYANYAEASNTALNTFMSGERLFYFTEPWSMANLVNEFASRQSVDEATLIAETLGGTTFSGWFALNDNAAKNSVYGDSHFFAMTKNVKDINKKAAILEFIKWFTSNAEIGAEWAKAGHISASKIITADQAYSNSTYVTNFIGKFYGNIDNFRCIGATPYYDAITSNIKGIFADTVDASDKHSTDKDYATILEKQKAANSNIGFFG